MSHAFGAGVMVMGLAYVSMKIQVWSVARKQNDAITNIRREAGFRIPEPLKAKPPVTTFGAEINDKASSTWNRGILKIHSYLVQHI
ncbi:hypothetical protein AAMO2058_000529900 [Amorphochlora amoebiformis]|eukprot:1363829-Amorphochlora_amoeboformis.AAC.1